MGDLGELKQGTKQMGPPQRLGSRGGALWVPLLLTGGMRGLQWPLLVPGHLAGHGMGPASWRWTKRGSVQKQTRRGELAPGFREACL